MVNFTRFSTPVSKSFFQVRKGDVISTLSDELAYDRIPKGGKNWYGKSMSNGKSYRVRLNTSKVFTVIGTYDFVTVPSVALRPSSNDVNLLSSGDLFVIKHGRGDNAELFRYVRSTDKKVIAVNPITNKTFNIDKSFTFTKVANLPY
jgi:hypothetical protein